MPAHESDLETAKASAVAQQEFLKVRERLVKLRTECHGS